MLLALREAVEAAGSTRLDLDALAQQFDTDRGSVRAAIDHGIARGWVPDLELTVLPAGCGTAGCAEVPASPRCRRCPLLRGRHCRIPFGTTDEVRAPGTVPIRGVDPIVTMPHHGSVPSAAGSEPAPYGI